MSNLSIKAAFREDKFNLKMIMMLFIMLDFFLYPIFNDLNITNQFFYLVLFEVSLLLSLMYGLRGQGRYKQMMVQLQSIALNTDMTMEEREARLVGLIHHACLELGHIYEERNIKYRLFTKKNEKFKIDKKVKGGKIMKIDEIVWKQIGYSIVGIWGVAGILILDILYTLNLRPLWITAILGVWYILDAFIGFYIHYIFKLEALKTEIKEEIKALET